MNYVQRALATIAAAVILASPADAQSHIPRQFAKNYMTRFLLKDLNVGYFRKKIYVPGPEEDPNMTRVIDVTADLSPIKKGFRAYADSLNNILELYTYNLDDGEKDPEIPLPKGIEEIVKPGRIKDLDGMRFMSSDGAKERYGLRTEQLASDTKPIIGTFFQIAEHPESGVYKVFFNRAVYEIPVSVSEVTFEDVKGNSVQGYRLIADLKIKTEDGHTTSLIPHLDRAEVYIDKQKRLPRKINLQTDIFGIEKTIWEDIEEK
jgi:hypothetical protein